MNKSKFFTAFASLLLLTGCTENADFFTPLPQDTDDEKVAFSEVYDGILGSLENMTLISRYEGFVDSDDAETAFNQIRRSRPEFFWANGYTLSSKKSSSQLTINNLYNYSTEQAEGLMSKLEAAADSVISGISPDWDDFGKVLYVHDYIVNNTVYDHDGAESEENGLWVTAYGCLVEGKAICQGYSDAFQYVMNRMGITCGTVTGHVRKSDPYSENDEGEMYPHAWNYVSVAGKYYWLDVTWDDPDEGKVAGSPIMHTYCLLDDERMLRTRTLNPKQKFIPHCYSMDDNYYVRNGTYIALYSANTVGSAIAAYSGDGEAELMFAGQNVYNEAMSSLFEGGDLWLLNDYADIGNTVNYTSDDNMYVIKIAY